MTKSKPKPVKPVLAWAVADNDGIALDCIGISKVVGKWYAQLGSDENPRRLIRVEIRPAPKRKSKRTKP